MLTGAGISAESGLPTFRDADDGLWAEHDPYALASPDGFRKDPALVWRWYRWRREIVANAEPNAGHIALARLAAVVPRLTLITQNVDGLHQRAGSHDIIEFHGNLFENRCFDERSVIDIDDEAEIPTCPNCGGLARPGVVWFGEAIAETALNESFAAAADCDVFLSVGTSSQVYPAAGLAEAARDAGAVIVEINPEPTDLASGFRFALRANAGAVLPNLLESIAR